MPTGDIDIESYTVAISQSGPEPHGSRRSIGLASPVLTHGIQTNASVIFVEGDIEQLGVVTNVDQPNYEGHNIFAHIRLEDFAPWYDLLRNESPLKLRYRYEGRDYDPERPVRDLLAIRLFTGVPELPGDDPAAVLGNFPQS